jgi:hypothetical protein
VKRLCFSQKDIETINNKSKSSKDKGGIPQKEEKKSGHKWGSGFLKKLKALLNVTKLSLSKLSIVSDILKQASGVGEQIRRSCQSRVRYCR